MVEDNALYNLRWDAQRSALLGSVSTFYQNQTFVDTSLVADGQIFKAHKLILSASSAHLKNILESVEHQHAVLFLPPSIKSLDLHNLLRFIYEGEIKISRRDLKSFLESAKLLRIKGMDFDLDEELDPNIILSSSVQSRQVHSGLNKSPKREGSVVLDDDDGHLEDPEMTLKSLERDHQDRIERDHRLGIDEESEESPLDLHQNPPDTPPPPQRERSHSHPTVYFDLKHNQHTINKGNLIRSSRSPTGSLGDTSDTTREKRIEDDKDEESTEMVIDVQPQPVDLDDSLSLKDTHQGNNGAQCGAGSDERRMSMTISEYNQGGKEEGEVIDDDDDDRSLSISIAPEISLREVELGISDRPGIGIGLEGVEDRFPPQSGKLPHGIQITSVLQPHLQQLQHLRESSGSLQHSVFGGGSSRIIGGMQISGGNKLKPHVPKSQSQMPSEGILMRMMREPLQSASSMSISATKSISSSNSQHSSVPSAGFFGISETAHPPTSHGVSGHHGSNEIRKLKRFVQCTNCSKVLSSLSALKRHMEDVHCARIQGKCIICGRVYSSRNSLLTHVYSAHKMHHDYKQVARIIRESEFEKFGSI